MIGGAMDSDRDVNVERRTPRPFKFYFGQGQIVEEVSCQSRWHQPTIQLLEWDDGELSLRFCSYTHDGRFQRNPLVVSARDLAQLAARADKGGRLKPLLELLGGTRSTDG